MLQGTPNQNGGIPGQTSGNSPGSAITTWGYVSSCNCFSATGGKTTFAPIDTMTIDVNGQMKTLAAYANVDANGLKYDNGIDYALNGPFQCTALISQYLSLLGYKNAPLELPSGNQVVNFLAKWDGQYFDTSSKDAPEVGSIISMNTNDPAAGHVAIVKGVTQVTSNEIVVTLIEDNMTLANSATFAANRQLIFTRTNGTWSSTYQLVSGGPTYSVVNWATPTSLP